MRERNARDTAVGAGHALRPSQLMISAKQCSRHSIPFDLQDFVQSSQMSLFTRELGVDEGSHEFYRDFFTNNACSQAQDVHVVVLDTLMGRINVVTDSGANSGNLVGSDTDSDTAAAQQNAAIRLTRHDYLTDSQCVVGIVDRAIRICTAIDDRMARRLNDRHDPLLQRETAVITPQSDTHVVTQSRFSVRDLYLCETMNLPDHTNLNASLSDHASVGRPPGSATSDLCDVILSSCDHRDLLSPTSDQRERQLQFPSGSSNRVEGTALVRGGRICPSGIDRIRGRLRGLR